MAGTSIDSYAIDLSLNISDFKKKAEEARDSLNKTFDRANEDVKKLNNEFSSFQKHWGSFRGAGLDKKINELKQMKGVTKEVSAELTNLQKTLQTYWASNNGDKTAVHSALAATQGSITQVSTNLYQERLDQEQKITDKIREREALEAKAASEAKEAIDNQSKARQDGLLAVEKNAEYYKKLLEEIGTEYYRHIQSVATISENLEAAKENLEKVKEQAAIYFQANGVSYNSETGKGDFRDMALSPAVVDEVKRYNKEIDEQNKLVRDLNKTYDDLQKKLSSLSSQYSKAIKEQNTNILKLRDETDRAFSRISSSITTVLATLGATKFYKEAIEAAGELEKSTQRLVNLFGELGNEATYTATEIADSYGMSNKTASQTIGYVGNLMKAYGLSNKMALELAEGITELSADLASFSGGTKTAEQAAQSLSQALLGNYRATRDLGVAITDTEVKLMAKSLGMSTDALTQGELALLRYKVIQEQTVNVVGDFARSQDTYYVASQRATAAVEDMKAAFGDDLLPVLTKLLNISADVIDFVSGVPSVFRTMITTTTLLTASYIALRTVIGSLLTNIKKARLELLELKATEQGLIGTTSKLAGAMKTVSGLFGGHPVIGFISILTALVGVISLVSKSQQEEAEATTLSIDKLTEAIRNYTSASKAASEVSPIASDIASSSLVEAASDLVNQVESNMIKLTQETEKYENKLAKAKDKLDEIVAIYQDLANYESTSAVGDVVSSEYRKGIESEYYEAVSAYKKIQDELDETQSKYNEGHSKAVLELARAYRVNEVAVSKVLKGHEDLEKEVLKVVSTFDLLKTEGYSEVEILRAMNYEATGWTKEIEAADKKLLEYQNKRLENEGEYRRAVLSSIEALEEERKIRDKDILGRLYFESDNLVEVLSGKNKTYDEINEAVENLERIFNEAQEGGDIEQLEVQLTDLVDWDSLGISNTRLMALLKVMGESYDLYVKGKEVAEEDYANKVYKINEKLETRLTTLRSKADQTLKEQRDASLAKLSDTYDKYMKDLYASMGGDKGILGDLASDEDVANLQEAIKLINTGIAPIFKDGNTLVGDFSFQGEKAKEFFGVLLDYYKAYTQGRENIENDYAKKVADIQAKQQQTLNTLNAAVSKDREKIHQAELDNLEIEKERRLEAAKTNGEDLTMIDEEYALKRLQIEQEFNDETNEIRRSANRDYLETKKGLLSSAKATYVIEMELLDEELQYELDHVKETGKKEEEIRREYALKRVQLERETQAVIREERRSNIEDWNYGNVSQDGNFLMEGFEDYYNMFITFEDKFIEAKNDLQTQLADGWDEIMKGAEGTGWEGTLQKIEDAFTDAASDEDLLGIRTLIDELKVANPELAAAIEEIIPEDAWDKAKDRSEQRAKALANMINQTITKAIDALGQLLTAMEDAQMEETKRRISQMKEAYDDMKEQMEKRNDKANGRLTRSQKDAIERQKKMDEDELERQKSLIEEQENMLKEQEREQFERQKAFSIATATITGIQAAINAYTAGMEMAKYMGPAAVAAPAIAAGMMAASIAATAAQIAMISAQQPPSYAQGAYNLPQDQLANVHKGEMIIPKPFAQEIRENGGLSGGEITINVYGATDDVSVESNTVEGNQQLDIYLTQRVKTMVARGELDNALQTRYSISKNGRRS